MPDNNSLSTSSTIPELGIASDFVDGVIYVRETTGTKNIISIHGTINTITGFDAADFLSGSKTLESLIVAEDLVNFHGATANQLSQSEICSIVRYRFIHPIRGIVHVREKFKFYKDNLNQKVYYIGNITDRILDVANATSQNELLAFREAIDRFLICTITDKAGKIVYANRKFSIISGYAIKEILGNTHKIVNSNKQTLEFWKEFWNTIAHGKVWNGVVRNQNKNGQFYWEEKVVIPVLNIVGEIENFISLGFDISERWLMEDRTVFFKQAMDVSPDMILLVDLRTLRISDWNSRAIQSFGYSENILREKIITGLLQNVSQNEFRNYINTVLQNNQDQGIFEAEIITESGAILQTEIGFSLYKSFESGTQVVLSIRDISAKYEMQRTIESNKVEINEAGHIAKLGTWIWTPFTERIVISEGAARIIELNEVETEISFNDFMKLIHPVDLQLLKKSIGNVSANNTPQTYNYRIATSSGAEKYIMLKRSKIHYTKDGKVDTVVGFVQDITEFRLSQIENEYYHEKMEQLMFQSSHHLRASVSTILGVVELFKTNRMKPEEFQIFLKYISDAATEADESLRYICRKLQEGKSSQ